MTDQKLFHFRYRDGDEEHLLFVMATNETDALDILENMTKNDLKISQQITTDLGARINLDNFQYIIRMNRVKPIETTLPMSISLQHY